MTPEVIEPEEQEILTRVTRVRDFTKWVPLPQQALFASLPWTIKEAFYGGAVGGGKSDLLLMLVLLLQLHTNPRFKQLLTRRTFKELKLEIVPRSRDIYRKFGATFNQTDMAWTFPRVDQFGSGYRNDGAMVFFGHIEHEKNVHDYDGMEVNIFSPDELTHLSSYMYSYIAFTRVRTSDPSLPAIIRGAGMPGGIGHTFVKKRFVDPAKDGGVVILDKRTGGKRFFVKANFNDNPYLEPGYKQSIDSLPEAERRAKYGDWDAFQGQVFDDFREFHYPDEPEHALHVVEMPDIPDWWPRICVGDWGYAALTWIGFGAISPNGRVYLYRELVYQKTKISLWAPEVREFVEAENVKLVKFCKSAGQDRGQDQTIQQQIEKELGRTVELTSNTPGSRVAGKMLIHEYLRWKPKPEIAEPEKLVFDEFYAMQLLRTRGPEAHQNYLAQFVPKPEEVLPKLLIDKSCTYLIEAIKACTYDPKKVEDIQEFEGDDPIDGLRYLVDAAHNYVRVANQEMERYNRREAIANQLAATSDHTAYYRNMRKFEAENTYKGVRRYQH